MICLPLATPFFLFHKLCGTQGLLSGEAELIYRLNSGNQRANLLLPKQRILFDSYWRRFRSRRQGADA